VEQDSYDEVSKNFSLASLSSSFIWKLDPVTLESNDSAGLGMDGGDRRLSMYGSKDAGCEMKPKPKEQGFMACRLS